MSNNVSPMIEDVRRILVIGPAQSGKSSIISEISGKMPKNDQTKDKNSVLNPNKSPLHLLLLGEEFIFFEQDFEAIVDRQSTQYEHEMIFRNLNGCIFVIDIPSILKQENPYNENVQRIFNTVKRYSPDAINVVFLHKWDISTDRKDIFTLLNNNTNEFKVFRTSVFDSSLLNATATFLGQLWSRISIIKEEFMKIGQELDLLLIRVLTITGMQIVDITLDEELDLPSSKDLINYLLQHKSDIQKGMKQPKEQVFDTEMYIISLSLYNIAFTLLEANTILLVGTRDIDNLQMAFSRLIDVYLNTRPSLDEKKSQKWANWREWKPKFSERRRK